jgi:hypothetical protein
LRRDKRTAFLGAEDAMEIGADVGHGVIQPSLRDFGNSELYPQLKLRAIVKGSCGTGKRPRRRRRKLFASSCGGD